MYYINFLSEDGLSILKINITNTSSYLVRNPHTGGKYAKDNFGKRSVHSQDEESGKKTKNKTNTAYEFNSCEVWEIQP